MMMNPITKIFGSKEFMFEKRFRELIIWIVLPDGEMFLDEDGAPYEYRVVYYPDRPSVVHKVIHGELDDYFEEISEDDPEIREILDVIHKHAVPIFVVSDQVATRICKNWATVQEAVYDWYSYISEEPETANLAEDVDLTIDIFDLEEEDIEIANARIREREREIVRELFGEYRPDSMNVLRIQHDYRIF